MKISYGITVHNEVKELNKLLNILVNNIRFNDEIVICDDYSNKETKDVIEHWDLHSPDSKNIKYFRHRLNGDFAKHKNSVIKEATGDFIFHIDADEFPNEILLEQIPQIIEMNDVDLIWIPRVNTLKGHTEDDVNKWGWRVNEKGWINYPDYQARVFRNHEDIKWTRPLHEYITGCKTYAHLPPHEELSLYHPKTIEKQELQNKFYNENFSREMNIRR